MPSLEEITGPGGERGARRLAVLRAQHVTDERRQRLGIAGGGRSEHEAVTEIADHHAGLGKRGRIPQKID
jgi:hypothetical protein